MRTSNQLSRAERIADVFGVVLGAASAARQVSETRVATATRKVRLVLQAAANDAADATAADRRLDAAVEMGRVASQEGRLDPDDAEQALAEIERKLAANGGPPGSH